MIYAIYVMLLYSDSVAAFWLRAFKALFSPTGR